MLLQTSNRYIVLIENRTFIPRVQILKTNKSNCTISKSLNPIGNWLSNIKIYCKLMYNISIKPIKDHTEKNILII